MKAATTAGSQVEKTGQPGDAAAGLRQILLNGSALLGAYVVPRALTFTAALIAARLLGPEQFGAYGTAASFAMILSIVASLGMMPLLVRELARTPERAATVLGAAHLIKLAAVCVMIALTFVMARVVLDYPDAIVRAALILALGHACTAVAENLGAWFQAQERMHVWLEANVAFGLVSGALGIALVAWTHSVPAFAAAFAAGQLAALLWLSLRMPAHARAFGRAALREMQPLLRATAPFAVAFLALTIFYKFDVLLLQRLRPTGEVGIYAAGYKLVDVVHALAVVAAGAIYPRLARSTTSEARAFASKRTLELFLLIGVAGSATLWLARDPLVQFLFGDAYADTASVLALLAPALIGLVVNILAGYLLSAADRVAPLAIAYIGACLLKLLLGIWWIPLYGAVGMAWAKLASEVSLALVLMSVLTRAGAPAPGGRALTLALGALALAALFAMLTPPGVWAAAGFLGAVAYLYTRGQALTQHEQRIFVSALGPLRQARP